MPLIVIILLAYYGASALWTVARGPYTTTLTPRSQAVRLVFGVATMVAWLSLPVCGGLPFIVYAVVVWIGLLGVGILTQTGKEIDTTAGSIAFAVVILAIYAAILLSLGYCV